jgi:5'-nucleotidase / UDP-sugar diphosphatase
MDTWKARAISRREFIRLGGGVALLASFPRLLRGERIELDRVSIFHTTDLHGNILPTATYDGRLDVGGLARCGKRLKEWRRMFPHSLTLDLGDLYQGTDASLRNQGQMMIECLNHLDFDAWVVGNHEFDWGVEALHAAVASSRMPVLGGNVKLHHHRVWEEDEREASTLSPYLIKELNGYRIAVIGLTTPNMANWFLPALTAGFAAFDPVPAMERILAEVKAQRPDAIVLACHMGVRPFAQSDDEGNRLFELSRRFPEIDAILGAHTHRDSPELRVNGIPYTQANYFGINLGHLELHFNRATRQLVGIRPSTELMDSRFGLDPEILALTRTEVEASASHLATPVGVLKDQLDFVSSPGQPSNYERLICTAILEGLERRNIPVDACIHGLLFTNSPLLPGEKTVADMWTIIPFENFVATAEVSIEELRQILEEVYRDRNHRSLVGLKPTLQGRGSSLRVTAIHAADGRELAPDDKIRIAINSYDAASGGGRFPVTRELLARPASRMTLHRWQSRALVIEFFEHHSPVTIDALRA